MLNAPPAIITSLEAFTTPSPATLPLPDLGSAEYKLWPSRYSTPVARGVSPVWSKTTFVTRVLSLMSRW